MEPPKGGRKHPEQELVKVDTSNILFICGGAFDGIEKKIAARLNTSTIGFSQLNRERIDPGKLMHYILPQDLRAYGLIPELVGRLPVLTWLDKLDHAALRSILTEPRNAIVKQYVRLFELEGIALTFDDEALDYIVDKAVEFGLGARGLRSICEGVMLDVMFEVPSQKGKKTYRVTLDYAREKIEGSTRLKKVG